MLERARAASINPVALVPEADEADRGLDVLAHRGRPSTWSGLPEDVDALVVGGGCGGLLTAAGLREAGVEHIRIVESGSDFGGTWYWNRYPNAACDIESYIYFPLLEETGYMPKGRYSKAPDIRTHCRRIAERYGLYDRSAFSSRVKSGPGAGCSCSRSRSRSNWRRAWMLPESACRA